MIDSVCKIQLAYPAIYFLICIMYFNILNNVLDSVIGINHEIEHHLHLSYFTYDTNMPIIVFSCVLSRGYIYWRFHSHYAAVTVIMDHLAS